MLLTIRKTLTVAVVYGYSILLTRSGPNAGHRQNQGHFEPANNYQRYIVLHSGTIEYQENSIWRRSRLDLQRRVFRTMTYTIGAPQIFYLMKRKRKRKEDLQVNLWDFSRQSDDMMSEF